MPALLTRFFKPKWKNPDADIRLEAIRQLSWENPEEKPILQNCLREDPSEAVREQALMQIERAEALIEILESPEASLAARAKETLFQLAEKRPEYLENLVPLLLDTPKAGWLLRLPVREELLHQLVTAIEARFPDDLPEWLLSLPSAAKRLQLGALLQSRSSLETLNRLSKGRDKGVYQSTKNRLQAFRDLERESEARQRRLSELTQQLETLATTEQVSQYSERLTLLARQLEALGGDDFKSEKAQALQALNRCREREAGILESLRAKAEQEAARVSRLAELTGTLQIMEDTHRRVFAQPLTDHSEAAALDALVKTQKIRWEEATAEEPAPTDMARTFQDMADALRNYQASLQRYLSVAGQITEHLQELQAGEPEAVERRSRELRQILERVQWPAAYPAPEPLIRARKLAGHHQAANRETTSHDYSEQRAAAQELMQELDAAVAEGAIRKAQPLMRKLTELLRELPEGRKKDFMQQLLLEQKRLDELRDWMGFAARPKLEDLIERMQVLSNQPLEPHDKARKIRELQSEWKHLGGTSDRQLWEQFREASDKAFEPCHSYFEEEKRLKQSNLEKRAEITEQLSLYLDSTDWNAISDWRSVERINRQARQDWRQYYPIDQRAGKKLQQRFNQLLGTLESHLNVERDRNQALKQAIVEQARALVDSEDLKAATQQAKALQKEWQQIGITHPKADRALWKAFRQACDALFGRLQTEREARSAEQSQLVDQAREVLEAMASLEASLEPGAESVLHSYRERFEALGSLGKEGKTLTQAFENHWRECQNKLQRMKQEKRVAQWLGFLRQGVNQRFTLQQDNDAELPDKRLQSWLGELDRWIQEASDTPSTREILIQLEILAGVESSAEDQDLRMALQVQRLAAGMQGKQETTSDRMEGLLKQWLAHPALSQPEAEEATPRIVAAVAGIIARKS